jgi:hypothetical protein
VLERRNTGTTSEDHSSGRSRSIKKQRISRTSTRTLSSMSSKNSNGIRRVSSMKSTQDVEQTHAPPIPSLSELQKEEEEAREEQESELAKKRELAQELAVDRGLSSSDKVNYSGSESEICTDNHIVTTS